MTAKQKKTIPANGKPSHPSSVRLDAQTTKEATEIAERIGWSFNQYVERALQTFTYLATTPKEKLKTPDALLMARFVCAGMQSEGNRLFDKE